MPVLVHVKCSAQSLKCGKHLIGVRYCYRLSSSLSSSSSFVMRLLFLSSCQHSSFNLIPLLGQCLQILFVLDLTWISTSMSSSFISNFLTSFTLSLFKTVFFWFPSWVIFSIQEFLIISNESVLSWRLTRIPVCIYILSDSQVPEEDMIDHK